MAHDNEEDEQRRYLRERMERRLDHEPAFRPHLATRLIERNGAITCLNSVVWFVLLEAAC